MKPTNKSVIAAPVSAPAISVLSVSESLLNGSSRLAEIAAAAGRIASAGKRGKGVKAPTAAPIAPVVPSRVSPASIPSSPTLPVKLAIEAALDGAGNGAEMELAEDSDDELKERFQLALSAGYAADYKLGELVAEMAAAGVERAEAIEWGLETGLSESYVRNTVSRLYTELTGKRERNAGGGRKANKGAQPMWERALRECSGDAKKALALLLAARNYGLKLQEKAAPKSK